MAGNIMLEVVTPDKAVVSEEAQIVVAPGNDVMLEKGDGLILFGRDQQLRFLEGRR